MTMKKKLIAMLAVFAVMAVVLSLVAMAEDGASELPNVGVLTAMIERLTLFFKGSFSIIDKIYAVITEIWC